MKRIVKPIQEGNPRWSDLKAPISVANTLRFRGGRYSFPWIAPLYPWTSPGGNTPQGTNYTATCLPSRKLSKLDEPDMQDTAGEARMRS